MPNKFMRTGTRVPVSWPTLQIVIYPISLLENRALGDGGSTHLYQDITHLCTFVQYIFVPRLIQNGTTQCVVPFCTTHCVMLCKRFPYRLGHPGTRYAICIPTICTRMVWTHSHFQICMHTRVPRVPGYWPGHNPILRFVLAGSHSQVLVLLVLVVGT